MKEFFDFDHGKVEKIDRCEQGRSQHIATYRIAIGFALRYIAKRLRYIAKLRG
jgi:hypothetical protein